MHPAFPILVRRTLRPWFALRSGAWAGQALPPVLDTADEAAALACALAGRTGRAVSLPAAGELTQWPQAVRAALLHSGLRPERLQLTVGSRQIRESPPTTHQALAQLREQGVGLALQDFGPATIGLLDRLPLTAVILTTEAARTPPAAAVLHAVIELALARRLTVIAAGIETEPQRALLSGLGCHLGEGALFGTGLPPQILRCTIG